MQPTFGVFGRIVPLNDGGAKAASDDILWGVDPREREALDNSCSNDIVECVSINLCKTDRRVGCSSGIETNEAACGLLLVRLSVNNVSGSDDGTVESRLKTGSCSEASNDVNDKWRVLRSGRRTVSDCGVDDGV